MTSILDFYYQINNILSAFARCRHCFTDYKLPRKVWQTQTRFSLKVLVKPKHKIKKHALKLIKMYFSSH